MKHWINKNYKTLIIAAFLIPIITVAIVSISHVTKWYGISNPVSWAIYLSIGIEIAALSALAAISADMGKKVYFPFAIVTIIQFVGNIFFAYSYIDINDSLFKDWVDLVAPLVSFMGVEPTDFVGHKRFLAFFAGGMLPIISLSFLHMLVKFTEEDRMKEEKVYDEEKRHIIDDKLIQEAIEKYKKEQEETKIDAKEIVSEVSRIRLSEEDLKKLEEVLLNPPPPNEALINAAEKYNETIKSNQLTEEEILKKAEEIQLKRVFERAELLKKEREEIHGYDWNEEEQTALENSEHIEKEKSIFPEEVEYPEEYNRPVYPSNEEREQILIEMMQKDEELGLYDVQPPINNEITPALSDEEVREMFMDEWEKKFEMVEDDEEITEPTEEEVEENFNSIVIPVDVAVDNEPEITQEELSAIENAVENETVSEPFATPEEHKISSSVDDEKKN